MDLSHNEKTQFSCVLFLSTVFIQMSETLLVTKMTLNEQHCTMNKRVVNYFLVSEIITPKG